MRASSRNVLVVASVVALLAGLVPPLAAAQEDGGAAAAATAAGHAPLAGGAGSARVPISGGADGVGSPLTGRLHPSGVDVSGGARIDAGSVDRVDASDLRGIRDRGSLRDLDFGDRDRVRLADRAGLDRLDRLDRHDRHDGDARDGREGDDDHDDDDDRFDDDGLRFRSRGFHRVGFERHVDLDVDDVLAILALTGGFRHGGHLFARDLYGFGGYGFYDPFYRTSLLRPSFGYSGLGYDPLVAIAVDRRGYDDDRCVVHTHRHSHDGYWHRHRHAHNIDACEDDHGHDNFETQRVVYVRSPYYGSIFGGPSDSTRGLYRFP